MDTSSTRVRLRPGDLVRVRSPHEIIATLDADGTLDNLPFMPEMLECCGKTFRVLNRVVQATIDGAFLPSRPDSWVREFKNGEVVTLRGVRCCGMEHDNCKRGCEIFWKVAWLEKIEGSANHFEAHPAGTTGSSELRSILKTTTEPDRYFCQSSEFLKATLRLTSTQRFQKCASAVAAGNITSWGMLKRLATWMWWKTYAKLIGNHVRGTQNNTPTAALDLQPGEFVEVKSQTEISATLNAEGRNRGLHFSADQRPYCGGTYRVRNRVDNFIAEGTGLMMHFRNTVTLEDVLCDGACSTFGGSDRNDFLYWREIWLRRVEPARVQLADTAITPAAAGGLSCCKTNAQKPDTGLVAGASQITHRATSNERA
jgi:hypothetical protein